MSALNYTIVSSTGYNHDPGQSFDYYTDFFVPPDAVSVVCMAYSASNGRFETSDVRVDFNKSGNSRIWSTVKNTGSNQDTAHIWFTIAVPSDSGQSFVQRAPLRSEKA
ncbi:MAG: hypothetical protein H6739_01450 [Alphaproteobacteria bacterium]|nr:hypothetical protein [Alphaproteobacteria bacterium]